jgi:hypothetical protein
MHIKTHLVWSVLAALAIACSEDGDEVKIIDQPPVPEARFTEQLDRIALNAGDSYDPEGKDITYQWKTSSTSITINNAREPKAFFKLPSTTKEETIAISLTVSDGKSEQTKDININVPPMTKARAYGLGRRVSQERSNNVPYEWYMEQNFTGQYSSINCGPTSSTMGIKWYSRSFVRTPEQARTEYIEKFSQTGWWSTDDIFRYLEENGVTHNSFQMSAPDRMKTTLDEGNIIILCLDMYYVTYNPEEEQHFGKIYQHNTPGVGHFIVIKGYKEVDGTMYYEAYDPDLGGQRYRDNTFKGKDRYYTSADLDAATQNWWDYFFVVYPPDTSGKRTKVTEGRSDLRYGK